MYYCSYDIVVSRYEKYLTFELKLASLRAPAVLKHSRHALKTNLRELWCKDPDSRDLLLSLSPFQGLQAGEFLASS